MADWNTAVTVLRKKLPKPSVMKSEQVTNTKTVNCFYFVHYLQRLFIL